MTQESGTILYRLAMVDEWQPMEPIHGDDIHFDSKSGRYLAAKLIRDYEHKRMAWWKWMMRLALSQWYIFLPLKAEFGIGESFPVDILDSRWIYSYEVDNARVDWKIALTSGSHHKLAILKRSEFECRILSTDLEHHERKTQEFYRNTVFSYTFVEDGQIGKNKRYDETYFAHWRKLIWSHDNRICLVGFADGTIMAVDPDAGLVSQRSNVLSGQQDEDVLFAPFSGICFLNETIQDVYRILAMGFDGTCFQWKISRQKKYLGCEFIREWKPL
jgi:hypothetical protein